MVIKMMLFKYSIMDEIYGLKKYENEFLIYDHNSLAYFDPLASAAICRQFASINCEKCNLVFRLSKIGEAIL